MAYAWLTFAAAFVLLIPHVSVAQPTTLNGGRTARFINRPGSERDRAVVRFTRDTNLYSIDSPLCPATSTVRIRTSTAQERFITLPCSNWQVVGSAYKYVDPTATAGGVFRVIYKAGTLIVKLKGVNYQTIVGPLDWAEVAFSAGARSYCGRFATTVRNDSTKVVLKGPSTACAAPTPTPTPTPTVAINCSAGFSCAAFSVLPGPGVLNPTDDGRSSWFRITNIAGALNVQNGTNGQFSPGPLVLGRSLSVDGSGAYQLRLEDVVFIGAPKPPGASGQVCFRIEQDPANTGWLHCGVAPGSNVTLTVDSNGLGPEDPPILTIGGGSPPPGAAVLRVRVQVAEVAAGTNCSTVNYSTSPVRTTAFTIGTATSTVTETRQNVEQPAQFPNPDTTVVLSGQPFDCVNWGSASAARASIAAPLYAMDVVPGVISGTYDVAQVLRLELDPIGGPATTPTTAGPTSTATRTPTITPSPTPIGPTPTPGPFTCPPGLTCAAFNIVPGPGDLLPADDGSSTWLRVFDFTGGGLFGNATNGMFGPSPVILGHGPVGSGGLAPLHWVGTSYLGANLLDVAQSLGQQGTVCVKIQPDPVNTGWIDCDGQTDDDVSLTVDSNLGGPPPPNPAPTLAAPGGTDPGAPAGAAVIRVLLQFTVAAQNNAPCNALDYSASPVIPSAFTTGSATSTVLNDWIDGQGPASAGPNVTTLAGVPFSCPAWGVSTGGPSSIAAPLFALDFLAPVVNTVVDVSQVFRLQLQPTSLPTGNETSTPTRTSTSTPTATATNSSTATVTHTLVPTSTPTSTFTWTPTRTPTQTPTSTVTSTATITQTFTPIPPPLGNVAVTNNTTNFGPTGPTFVGNCRTRGNTSGAVVSATSSSFTTRFAATVTADCESTLADPTTATLNASYTVQFTVNCPAGSTYELTVQTSINGAFTIRGDENEACSGAAYTSTVSTASSGMVTGSNSGGTLTSGSLNLTAPGSLVSHDSVNQPFNRTSTATITGTGTGSPIAHTLNFSWTSTCSSDSGAVDQGAECAVRLGMVSDQDCLVADDYPGVGSRDINLDGHFVTVTGSCGVAPTPTVTSTQTATQTPTVTSTPTNTLVGGPPTATPTATPTFTPEVTPLGNLTYTVATGPSGYCPTYTNTAQSYLRTHGNPTGGVPGEVCNGSKGNFTSGPIVFSGGVPDAHGIASLSVASPVVIGVGLPDQTPNCCGSTACGGSCSAMVCWRIEQDPSNVGWIDCDGGSTANASLTVNSNTSSAPPAPAYDPAWLSVPSPSSNPPNPSNAGTAAVRVLVKRLRNNNSTTCPGPSDAAWSSISALQEVMVTGTATSTINNPRQCSGNTFGTACPSANPYQTSLSGARFNCSNWTTNSGAALVIPFVNLDETIGGSFGTGDIAQALRLSD